MKIKKYILALLLLAILVNEQVLQWAVAVKVGRYAVSTGFQDAFKDFTVVGYLFASSAESVGELRLWKCPKIVIESDFQRRKSA
jgi:hypothetical protein